VISDADAEAARHPVGEETRQERGPGEMKEREYGAGVEKEHRRQGRESHFMRLGSSDVTHGRSFLVASRPTVTSGSQREMRRAVAHPGLAYRHSLRAASRRSASDQYDSDEGRLLRAYEEEESALSDPGRLRG
jgi:hypothetical protein